MRVYSLGFASEHWAFVREVACLNKITSNEFAVEMTFVLSSTGFRMGVIS